MRRPAALLLALVLVGLSACCSKDAVESKGPASAQDPSSVALAWCKAEYERAQAWAARVADLPMNEPNNIREGSYGTTSGLDPWGNPYVVSRTAGFSDAIYPWQLEWYRVLGLRFSSRGPDGEPATGDEIRWPSR